ncbi:MAG: TetR/AcrR family transcriptional regulator [Desulfobacter sp.]|nr:MAG: TetR/AcrR family transcriptional regulator [Desulfobacter sp.]
MGRKSKADQRRIQIIKVFYQCVVDQGVANASVRKIANAAGVPPSTLHHYFKNREEIIEEAVLDFTDKIFTRFNEQMSAMDADSECRDQDRVNQGIEFIFSQGMINENHTGFFLECCVAARHNPRIKATIAELFERFRKAIVDHLEQVPGFDRLDLSQKSLLASTVVAIHEGIELQWFADPEQVNLAQTLATTRNLIDFFIKNAGNLSSKGG